MTADSRTAESQQREIFLCALEKSDAEERRAFLDQACPQDTPLRGKVEELLRRHEAVGDFLEKPALAPIAIDSGKAAGPKGTALVANVTEKPGDRIGRYKLLQLLGEGGCGTVYMAEQEEPVRRRVALKIIKLGMDTRQVIARFEAERQALALMDHPNIARVLDAGATETGRPFFVMELVRGIKITDYCDKDNVGTRERLELFISVCQAIQHAHQKGIIHRDIKPSNILVTLHDGTPVPKVIDFGVAKATTQQRLTNLTVFTAFEQFIGTPAYMSPEQAEMSGLDIDTRSDIYSLGVLLYELLTGKTPFDADKLLEAGLDECRRTIRDAEPMRPSNRLSTMVDVDLTTAAKRRGTEAPRLIHLLRGDLDWVVMRCLEKDRTRRYATANDLATDVQRFLDGDPVLACPPTALYRFRKMVQRHRTGFAAAAAVSATLLLGATFSTWQAVRATKAERNAHAAQQQEALLRRQAENGWERARERGALARLNAYVADVNLAQQALQGGNYGRAVHLLNKHRPQPGETDLRGFEWRYLYELCKGDTHVALPDQDGAVMGLAFSPGGNWIAVGLREQIRILDLQTKLVTATIPASGMVLRISSDGTRLYCKGMRGVQVWNTADWSLLKTLPTEPGPGHMNVSGDGSRLAISSRGDIRVWNTASWEEVDRLPGGFGPIAFSPDGQLLAAANRETITIFDLEERKPKVVLEDSADLFAWLMSNDQIAFLPDGKSVIATQNSSSEHGVFVLRVWDVRTGKQTAILPESPRAIEHTGVIQSLTLSPDGRFAATASCDHSVRLWDLASRRCIATLQGHLNEAWAVAFSPNGLSIVSGAKDGGLKLWPARGERKEDTLTTEGQPVAISRDGRTLATLEEPGTVVFNNLITREQEKTLTLDKERPRPSFSVSFSADLKTMAQAISEGRVKLTNTENLESSTIKVAENPIGFVRLSPDARDLIAGGGFGQDLRWVRLADNSITNLAGSDQAVFSPDGKTLAAYGRASGIQLWDVQSRSLRNTLPADFQVGPVAAFTQDSRFLATAGSPFDPDQGIRLWDTATGKLLGSFEGHKQAVWSLSFAPDGKTLASASDDGTLKLWNIATKQELLSVRRVGSSVRGLSFLPDGKTLAAFNTSRSQPGQVQFYRAPLLADIDRAPVGTVKP